MDFFLLHLLLLFAGVSIEQRRNICREADLKREDMKWLVQTLDLLSSHSPEKEVITEQNKLEALITRYKNLIPTIEVTMVKTEVYSKCYTYRREVREVCNLLKKVKEQSTTAPKPESLDIISQQIKQQELAVNQLDQQRANIMSMLQRGKDLTKDQHAPTFIKEEVRLLETGWNETYEETVEKLKKLRGTQKLWSNYNEQKNEILELLARAEEELKRIRPGHYNLTNIAADLQAKQEMSIHLREATEDMLRKLRDLCSSLVDLTAIDKQPILKKEVTEIEKRLQVTMETVQERVVFLQQFSAKWTKFQSRLGELQTWTVQNVPSMMSAIQIEDITPEARVKKTAILQEQLQEKVAILDALEDEATDLLSVDQDNPEAIKLRDDVSTLKQKITALSQSVHTQSTAVTKDLSNWQKYQASIQEIKPWIEQAEVKVAMGFAKPLNLQEAVKLQHEARLFEKDCEEQLSKLQTVSIITQQMTCKSNAHDEVDTLHSKWTTVHDTAVQWADKLDKLVANWKEFDTNASKIENWIVESDKKLQGTIINLNTPQVEKLEKELVALKAFNNVLSEQQAKQIKLTQISDSISHGMDLEGVPVVKNRVVEMKAKVTDMVEAVRAKINDLSDVILSRQEFHNKMVDFNNWMDQLRGQVAQIDEINAEKVDVSLQQIHALLQEHSDKHPLFSSIYEEVKNLTLHSVPEEAKLLNETYTTIVTSYKDLEDNLQQKKKALEKWSELLNWHEEAGEQLNHIKYQVESQKVQPEELEKIFPEIDTILTKIATWKVEVPNIDSATNIQIRDKATGKPLSANILVRELEVRAVNLKSRLSNKIELLQKVGVHWNHFQQLEKDISDKVSGNQKVLSEIIGQVTSCNELEPAIAKINHLIEVHHELQPLKDKIHEEGNQLMKDDQGNVAVIQKALSSLDDNWDKVNELLKEQKLKFSEMSFAWKEFQDAKQKADKEIEKVNSICDRVNVPNDSTEASLNHDKVKKAMEALKKSKLLLDKMDAKGQIILKKSESVASFEPQIRSELNGAHENWDRVHDRLTKLLQQTESQYIIWKYIDDTKNNLVTWLNETADSLKCAVEKPGDITFGQAKLQKYKEELPKNMSLKTSIVEKYEQLKQLNNGQPLPTLEALIGLLETQFSDLQVMADNLDALTSTFGEHEKNLKSDIKKLSNKISEIRESIIKCEDLTGDNAKVLERLRNCRDLKSQLKECDVNLQEVKKQIDQLKEKYPSFAETNLPKELVACFKRYDGVCSHADKIEGILLSFLKKYHLEKQNTLQRLLTTQKEKILWCEPEAGSDKYNLEVKLGSLVEVENGLEDCEKKKIELEESLKILESVEVPEVISTLDSEKNKLVQLLEDLKKNGATTKELLNKNISLWQNYETKSEAISTWLKEMEGRIRLESVNQMNLSQLAEKMKEIEELQKEVSAFEKEMQDFKLVGESMVKELPESRIEQFVTHLQNRYQAIVKFVSNFLERLDILNANKDLYNASVKDLYLHLRYLTVPRSWKRI